jgi:hypothetical protein
MDRPTASRTTEVRYPPFGTVKMFHPSVMSARNRPRSSRVTAVSRSKS